MPEIDMPAAFGQVGEPVRAREREFAGVGQQQPHVLGGLFFALAGIGQGGQQHISGWARVVHGRSR